MQTATVSKLKASLSEYLRQVKTGERSTGDGAWSTDCQTYPGRSIRPSATKSCRIGKTGIIKIGTGKLPKNFGSLPRPKDPKGWC